MAPPVEILVQVVVNELIEKGLVPPEYRGEAIKALSRAMRVHTRGFVCNLLRAAQDGVAAASIAAHIPDMALEKVS
jgi:hypothetical protein